MQLKGNNVLETFRHVSRIFRVFLQGFPLKKGVRSKRAQEKEREFLFGEFGSYIFGGHVLFFRRSARIPTIKATRGTGAIQGIGDTGGLA